MAEETRNGKPFYRLPLKTAKQKRYVEGVFAGKTKLDAALDAGYAESTARSASGNIEGPAVRAAFQQIIREAVPIEKFKQRMAEGVDATITRYFQFEGTVSDARTDPDFKQRHEYLVTAAKFGGYYVEKAEIDVNDHTVNPKQRIDELISLALARRAALLEPAGTDGASQPS